MHVTSLSYSHCEQPKSKYNTGLIARLRGTFAYVEERDKKKKIEWTLM